MFDGKSEVKEYGEMECCRCDKEIDLAKELDYEYDYAGNIWCKPCMEEEVNRKY